MGRAEPLSQGACGVGIDLVAGSVVIRYDRWWNAAREDDPHLAKILTRDELLEMLRGE